MRKEDLEPKPSRAERTLQKMTTALRKECNKIRGASRPPEPRTRRFGIGWAPW
ncbi:MULTISPECIES: hypothetical protein [Sorangium]|uniref:Uncharacterized protein n=1 Tax=Sorangium cellulosum TaxID=56 RepID=A0A4P2R6E8_SORCE|nr:MULTISPECIES: hypothetical protein [Sorangium]AUX37623.1 uncharacterized protein SOCE836_098530 [Sorangium cellulosum]WCQ96913.1 hypothetical protein NQZ70_09703 [Sorangium sp. Soce836]